VSLKTSAAGRSDRSPDKSDVSCASTDADAAKHVDLSQRHCFSLSRHYGEPATILLMGLCLCARNAIQQKLDKPNSWNFTHLSHHNLMQPTRNCRTASHRKKNKLEMWANAQRDGHPAEYRWRPLFNAAKFGWRPQRYCRAVTLPRRETCWNLQGCSKLANRSQPLVGWSSHIIRTCGGGIAV